MKKKWDGLIKLLQSHLDYHQIMLQIADEKKEALIANEVDHLLSILEREEGVAKRMQELEEERKRALQSLGIDNKISFQKFLDSAPEEKKEDLSLLRAHLLKTLEVLKEKNETNAMLINESLDLNEFSIQLFTNSNMASTYSPWNTKKREVSYRLFDEKA